MSTAVPLPDVRSALEVCAHADDAGFGAAGTDATIDVTDVFDARVTALRSHASQLAPGRLAERFQVADTR